MPPPVHGASLATKALFEADLAPLEKHLLEIRSSKELQEVGKASLKKVLGLFSLVVRCVSLRIRSGATVLYYTPGSANLVPFVRDVVFLGLCRWMFRRTVLHYHSGGLIDFLSARRWRKVLGQWAYGRGAWALTLSEHVAVPGLDFGAARVIEVPNGLDIPAITRKKSPSSALRILFLGNLYEDKGVFDLLEACQRIAQVSSFPIHLQFVGKWPDAATEEKFHRLVTKTSSLSHLEIPEPSARYGEEKWQAYAEADLFVFPSQYRSENFPLVILEAMASGLPVISTRWRGIPSIVVEGETGFLHQPGDIDALQTCIQKFMDQPDLLERCGQNALLRYQDKFTFAQHRKQIVTVLQEACS